jgi:hypothetical protein
MWQAQGAGLLNQPPLYLDDDSDDDSDDIGRRFEPTRIDMLATGGTILPKSRPSGIKPQLNTWLPDMLEVIRTPETPRELRDVKHGGLSQLKPFACERSSKMSAFPSTASSMASMKSTASSKPLRRVNEKRPGRKAHPKKLGPKNIKPKFKREYDGSASVRQILEPDLRLQSWLSNFKTEQQSFESIAVYAESKLSEVRSATAGLATPNAYRTAVCCDILGKMRLLFGRYDHLMVEVMKEVLASIYIDSDSLMGAHILPSGAEQLLHLGKPYFEDWQTQRTRLELTERKLMLWETKRSDMETMLSKSMVVLKIAIRTWQRLYLSRFMDEWRIWIALRKQKLVRFQRQRTRIWFFGWKYKSRESKMMKLMIAAEDAERALAALKKLHAKKLSELMGMIEALRNENKKMKSQLAEQAMGLGDKESLLEQIKVLQKEVKDLEAAMKQETSSLKEQLAKVRKMHQHEQAWRIKLELEIAGLKQKLAAAGGGGGGGGNSDEVGYLMEMIAQLQAQTEKLKLDNQFLNDQNADLLEQIARLTAGSLITVGPDKGHNHSSISAAMAAACDGDTIVVNPGTYSESVDLKPGVKIMSVPNRGRHEGQTVRLGGGERGFDFGDGRLTDRELMALRDRINDEWTARNGHIGDEDTHAQHALLTKSEKEVRDATMRHDQDELKRLKALVDQRNRELANLNARLLKAGGNYVALPTNEQTTQTTEDLVIPTQWMVSDVDGVATEAGSAELHFQMTNVTDDNGMDDIMSYDVYWEDKDDPSLHGTIMVTADMLKHAETNSLAEQLVFDYDIGEEIEIDLDGLTDDEGETKGKKKKGKKKLWQKSKVLNRQKVVEKVDGEVIEVTTYDVELPDGTVYKNVRNKTSGGKTYDNMRNIGGKVRPIEFASRTPLAFTDSLTNKHT